MSYGLIIRCSLVPGWQHKHKTPRFLSKIEGFSCIYSIIFILKVEFDTLFDTDFLYSFRSKNG